MNETINFACKLGAELLERAISINKKRSLHFFGLNHNKSGGMHAGILNNNLISGNAGIALAFAALFKLTGEKRWKKAALEVLFSPLQEINLQLRNNEGNINYDCYYGMAGMAYAIFVAGKLLAQKRYVKIAEDFVLNEFKILSDGFSYEGAKGYPSGKIGIYLLAKAIYGEAFPAEHQKIMNLFKKHVKEYFSESRIYPAYSVQQQRLPNEYWFMLQAFLSFEENLNSSMVTELIACPLEKTGDHIGLQSIINIHSLANMHSEINYSMDSSINRLDLLDYYILSNNQEAKVLLDRFMKDYKSEEKIYMDSVLPNHGYPSGLLGTGSLIINISRMNGIKIPNLKMISEVKDF